jgi:DNA-binding NarL/FixJ family response regulator
MTHRVLIADDQPIVRAGLAAMIDAESDLEVVGLAADGREAVDLARTLQPHLVLMDVRMPRLDGIAATREIIASGLAQAVVILTTFDDEEYLIEGIRAGAAGFLLKDSGPELIAAAIRAGLSGDTLIAPSMTRALLEPRLRAESHTREDPTPFEPPGRQSLIEQLSGRERDVLGAVARGLGNAEIARELWVSEATVKTHLSSVLAKTGTKSRVAAAVLAYETGFVRPGWLDEAGTA